MKTVEEKQKKKEQKQWDGKQIYNKKDQSGWKLILKNHYMIKQASWWDWLRKKWEKGPVSIRNEKEAN